MKHKNIVLNFFSLFLVMGFFVNESFAENISRKSDKAKKMESFLWKPLSDTKGPVAEVYEKHCNTTIRVNGQDLERSSASKGRCNMSMGTMHGCAYGKNIRVEVINNTSGKPYYYNGKPYVDIPDGCKRFQFQ